MLIKALIVMMNAHKWQKDKAGKPYFLHPLTVFFKVKGTDLKIVALLHDTVEDTDITLQKLSKLGFNDVQLNAIDAITKRKDEDYSDYLKRVKQNNIAREVKLADLAHNMNIRRLLVVTNKDTERIEKYKKALLFLSA